MVKLEVSLWGNEQVQPQAWPPGGLPSAGRGFACGRMPPARPATALPPRCLPAFLAATVLYFPLFLRIPTRSPPQKKSKEKKRKEKKEEVGGELLTHFSEKRRPSAPPAPRPRLQDTQWRVWTCPGGGITPRGRPVDAPSPLRRPLGKARVLRGDHSQRPTPVTVGTGFTGSALCGLVCEAHYSKYSTVVILSLKTKKLNESYLQKRKL